MKATNGAIKAVLESKLVRNRWITVQDIQKIIKEEIELDTEDVSPHTTSRETTYPKWKHHLQSVLNEMKKNQLVEHNEESESYKFK